MIFDVHLKNCVDSFHVFLVNGSDVDIALLGESLKLKDILDISIEIDKLFLPWKFDLVIFNRIKDEALVEHIKRVGIQLFE